MPSPFTTQFLLAAASFLAGWWLAQLFHLATIHNPLTQIMATQAELASELAVKTAQIRKAIDEITTRLAALEDAVRNAPATPELTAAVAALSTAVQAADDIVPDAPPAAA